MNITSKMVRELRDQTGAGMMECKKALTESAGSIADAIDLLRKSGLKAAGKKAERSTGEGRVFAAHADGGRRAHLCGLACETDFLAKTDDFKAFVASLEEHVRGQDPSGLEGERPLLEQPFQGEGAPLSEVLKEAAGGFGENTRLTHCVRMENAKGLVGTYVHHDGKQGAIVSVTTGADAAAAAEALRGLCQHIVVFSPQHTNREDVPASEVQREREVILAADDMKSKPEELREKIVLGRLNSFYAQHVLAEQPWILDDKRTVQKALEKALGSGAKIHSFQRVHLGS